MSGVNACLNVRGEAKRSLKKIRFLTAYLWIKYLAWLKNMLKKY